jgi:hypothetical protein
MSMQAGVVPTCLCAGEVLSAGVLLSRRLAWLGVHVCVRERQGNVVIPPFAFGYKGIGNGVVVGHSDDWASRVCVGDMKHFFMTALVRPAVISHHLTLIQPSVLLQLNLLLCPGPENLIEVFSVFIGLGRLNSFVDWVRA